MARISELHYSNAYSGSSGVPEFLEVALTPFEDPADFVVSFYQDDGSLGIEISLDDPGVTVTTDPDNGEVVYVISDGPFDIQLTDPDGGGATNYEAYALTNTATNTLIDFYDIGGGTQNIVAQSGAAADAAAPGQAVSTNIPVPTSPNDATYSIQFNQPNPNTADTSSGVSPGDTGLACFTAGTDILTDQGYRAVEDLVVGDLVLTRDSGLQPVRWIGQQQVSGLGRFAPVTIKAGHYGATRDITVSPQHRIFLTGWRAELLFAEQDVLVPAKALIDDRSVVATRMSKVRYVHIVFDRHQLVETHGLWSESYYPVMSDKAGWSGDTQAELRALFPDFLTADLSAMARPVVPVHLGRLLQPR